MTEIAIAFDVGSIPEALALDRALGDGPEYAKIGLQLYVAAGPEAVRALKDRGRRVFLDLKLHDIPNTVHGAAAAAGSHGVDLVTVHASGGEEMIRAAVEGLAGSGRGGRVVAVTILTSLDSARMPPGFRRPFPTSEVQVQMLEISERAGALGIVCSARDLAAIRQHRTKPFFAVTPGIRPAGGDVQDQKRVTTVTEAVVLGASMLVIGRPITAAPDPRAVLEQVREECREASIR